MWWGKSATSFFSVSVCLLQSAALLFTTQRGWSKCPGVKGYSPLHAALCETGYWWIVQCTNSLLSSPLSQSREAAFLCLSLVLPSPAAMGNIPVVAGCIYIEQVYYCKSLLCVGCAKLSLFLSSPSLPFSFSSCVSVGTRSGGWRHCVFCLLSSVQALHSQAD